MWHSTATFIDQTSSRFRSSEKRARDSHRFETWILSWQNNLSAGRSIIEGHYEDQGLDEHLL